MEYAVKVMPRARRDLHAIFEYIHADTSPTAQAWFAKLADAIASLSTMPLRNSAPPENPALRQLHFGSKPHIYRIIYHVDASAHKVTILHVRHGARNAFDSGDAR